MKTLIGYLVLALGLYSTLAQASSSNNDEEEEIPVSPECAAVLLVGGGTIGGTTIYMLATPLLAILGFTSTGVAGSSFAAWWQSTMPLIASGGLFATLQSIAMAGSGPGIITVGAGFLGGAVSASYLKEVCSVVDATEVGSIQGSMVATLLASVQTSVGVANWIRSKL